ncbi:hypothetical protein [Streptomyces alkaliterrae]|uniref:Uncharacterized protein n=1 Tax=Streptomyces alkaliterrae TaxID=2213162 RepID=A0A5P0YP60_9ACTN|nr:hypothetical protein [Streptomyces alkaliterrae]MBB1251854.1 hypothetical protein [Streptomyces alkaliterrae]MBB1259313.1 hypothetical protein [Streptomyces alkaliterrae]MQS00309.1 hypothetical protein [Streptomyces alkaliterrae]
MTGDYLALMACVNCKRGFTACPECVNTIRIDPETGYPPDAVLVDGKARHNPNPDPEAVKRSAPQPVCDTCVMQRNEALYSGSPEGAHIGAVTTLAAERHKKGHV